MNYRRWIVLLLAVLAMGLMIACGDSPKDSSATGRLQSAADAAEKAGEDLVAQAKEAVEDVAKASERLKKEIAEKESELEKLTDELKTLAADELAGDRGSALKSRQEELMEELKALKDKLKELVD